MMTTVKRYDYCRYNKANQFRYFIFDRQAGLALKLATIYDVADAEMICSALNNAEKRDNNEHHSGI